MQTIELHHSDLPLVFAVVREEFPRLGLEQWLNYAAPFVDRDLYGESRGIIAAQTALNRYRGLFLYLVETTLGHGRTLILPHVIVPQIPDRMTILECLLAAALDLARRRDCRAVSSTVPTLMAEDVAAFLGPRAEVSGLSVSLPLSMPDRRRAGSLPPFTF